MPRDLLRRYPLFNVLTARQLDVLVSAGQEQHFNSGETIFQEGARGIWAYLVLEGRVRVLRRSVEGRDISLGVLGPGELFGEYALLPPHCNTATCRAADPTRLLRLALLPLRPLFAALPGVGPSLKDWLRLHGLVSYLRGQTCLGFMSGPTALTFLDRLQPATFPAQHTIQAIGLGADRWYYIESGRVALQPGTREGEEARELGPGDCFGEAGLLGRDGLPTAVALTETRCQCLRRDAFVSDTALTDTPSEQSLTPQLTSLCKKYDWVGQQAEADCGVAALAMAARFHGLEADLDRLRELARVGEHGATLMGLQQAGTALGLCCQAVRMDLGRLAQVSLPVIAHLRSGHYVVLYEMGTGGVVVGDPATGIVRLCWGALVGDCSGNLLLIQPRGGAGCRQP
jgi:CRP-like cAMP-binding protein